MASKIEIRHSFRLVDRILFEPTDMRALGEVAADSQRQRIAQGLNIEDQPAKPLAKSYAHTKQRRGARPVRDLRLTGATMDAFGVLSAGPGETKVGFHGEKANKIAAINQAEEQMVGLSPKDHEVVAAAAGDLFGEFVSKALVIDKA